MQRPMRRKDREVSREEAEKILARAEVGVLSVLSGGEPYGVPLSYVALDGAVYFHCAPEGRKLDALRENPAVSFCAVAKADAVYANGDFTTRYESVIAEGRAEIVSDSDEALRAVIALCEKYVPGKQSEAVEAAKRWGARMAVVRIDVHTLSGKANRAARDG